MSKTSDKKVIASTDIALAAPSANDNAVMEHVSAELVLEERARVRADEISAIRSKLASSSDGHIARAADVLLGSGGLHGRMDDQSYRTFKGAITAAREALRADADLRQVERQYRSRVRVEREVNPYADGSPHSWLSDALREASGQQVLGRDDEARDRQDRLQRHGARVMRAVERQTGYGKFIARGIEARYRPTVSNPSHPEAVGARQRIADELRALTTDGGISATAPGGAAAFVPPITLVRQFATFRSPFAAFVSQLNDTLTLPQYGLEVAVPAFTSATDVAATSEGNSVSDTDPTATLNTVAVNSTSGKVTLSQAWLDRAGGVGITGDQFVMRQLRAQLDANNDTYAVTTALAGAQTVAGISTFTLTGTSGVGGLYGDLAKARKALTTTPGIYIRPTAYFAPDPLLDYASAWADASGRPVALPSLDQNAKKIGGLGYSGLNFAGLRAFADLNIPTVGTGSQYQIIVCDPSNVLWMAGQPIFSLMPSGGVAGNLEAWVTVRQYVACFPIWPQGIASITGAGYDAGNFA
ncbi:hypothetical protein [Conexibacter sp. S30A1]|uniref:hypothetical protein n=1 Tax=Conexibacter sp. S30A1 TaxID=2937800 RepID=UPI00200ED952|nr:hypothetical protein [Conexibacter sp. S30A1]